MRSAVLLVLAGLVAACASPTTRGSPRAETPAPSATGTGSAALSPCPDVELRTPSGDELDLTGTWLGNEDSYWVLTQVRGCLWGTTTDLYAEPAGRPTYWQIYLRGIVQPDFTVPIEFAYSPLTVGPDIRGYGHATLGIGFDDSLTRVGLTLTKIEGCSGGEDGPPCPEGEGTLQTTLWTRVSATITLPQPTLAP